MARMRKSGPQIVCATQVSLSGTATGSAESVSVAGIKAGDVPIAQVMDKSATSTVEVNPTIDESDGQVDLWCTDTSAHTVALHIIRPYGDNE